MADILIIEDDRMVGLLIKETLVAAGHGVRLADNGVAGLDLLEKHGADLVITDIVMPEMDGLEAINRLREKHPDLRVIAISGGGRWMNAKSYLKLSELLGASRTLNKPISPDGLLAQVEAVLKEPHPPAARPGP